MPDEVRVANNTSLCSTILVVFLDSSWSTGPAEISRMNTPQSMKSPLKSAIMVIKARSNGHDSS